MQPKDKIELHLMNIKIDLPTIIIEDPMLEIQKVLAQKAYRNQTENKKMLSMSRFWKSPKVSSLIEQCAQYIAQEIVKNDFKYDRRKLPSTLNELINQKIEYIRNKIESEVMQERKIAFLSSLNDKSWLKPS